MSSKEALSVKVKDYQRFVMTLIILNAYLYAGVLISLYVYETRAHLYMFPVITAASAAAFSMILKMKKWKRQAAEE
ncbi:YrhC family protein [Halobacillus litoralis]|uniref:YrhC family protein n=1 Tax=Halobacillus litoralis TaxID=45668 RepID=UPI001CD4F6B7|nr:YrhC family protein [Halobacillus litoralis]MCA1021670.1 YrhC family protein [Halobacillus litoralis]